MPAQQEQHAKALFLSLLDFESSADRKAYLDDQCADNEQLRSDVLELLGHQQQLEGFLEVDSSVAINTVDMPGEVDDQVGQMIGPYKIREKIGEGGMGYVYVAEQEKPVRRKVALKIIKPGMDTKEVLARFEAERQALAMMSHPNIAKVLDGGSTDQGRPYFVMELVKGIPITEYCDQHRLNTRERLELLITVCQAVQHAHMKGIIHRDLKPSNVIVELHDVVPVPKVIDFGIAKATNQRLTEHSVYTQLTQLIGTPLYMSPEQAQQSALDVDTRSDIYSLGVVLYELLTGETPFNKKTLSSVDVTEMRRIICEQDPPRPSARVSTLESEQISTLSEKRKTTPSQFSLSMKHELDWIVMKALEKDRTRRYESASAFAADLQRYLDDEPVQACPPSMSYQLRKYTKRHKWLLTTGAVILLTMFIATGVSVAFGVQASQEKENAVTAQEKSEKNFEAALDAIDKLLQHASSPELAQIPKAQPIRQKILEDVLEFYGQFSVTTGNSPVVRYRAGVTWLSLADLSRDLKDFEQAEAAFDEVLPTAQALAKEFPRKKGYQELLFKAINGRGQFYLHNLKKYEASRDDFIQARNQMDRLLVEIPEYSNNWKWHKMIALRGLADLAEKQHDEQSLYKYAQAALEILAELPTSRVGDIIYGNLRMANSLKKSDPDRAEIYYRQAIDESVPLINEDSQRDDLAARVSLLNHAFSFFEVRDTFLATELAIESNELSERLANNFPSVSYYQTLGESSHRRISKFIRKGRATEKAVQKLQETYFKKYPNSLAAYDLRISLLTDSEELMTALSEAIDQFPDECEYYGQRGILLAMQGRMDEALADFETTFEKEDGVRNLGHRVADTARKLRSRRQYADALAIAELTLEAGEDRYQVYVALGEVKLSLDRPEEALTHFNDAIERKTGGSYWIKKRVAEALYDLDRFAEAVTALEDAYEEYPDDASTVRWMRTSLVECPDENYRQRRFALIEKAYREQPDDPDVLISHAGVQIINGNLEDAKEDYNKAMQLADTDDVSFYQRSYIEWLTQTKKLPEAVAMFDEIIEDAPENPTSYLNRSVVYREMENYELALADLQKALELDTPYFLVKYHAALMAISLGKTEMYQSICRDLYSDEEALAALKESEQRLAGWMTVLGSEAFEDYQPAIEFVQTVLEDSPDTGLIHKSMGGLLFRSGKYAEAIPHLQKSSRLSATDPRSSAAYSEYLLAMVHHHLDQRAEATAAIKRANEIAERELSNEENPAAWNRKLTLQLLRDEAEELLGQQ